MAKTKTVYFSFHGDIRPIGVNNLIYNCNEEIKKGFNHIYISFSSGGGATDSGFHLYNTLKSLNAEITIHNTGTVESAALVVFLSGDNRFASNNSRFLLHQPMRKFLTDTSLDGRDLSEFEQVLKNDELNIRDIITQNTKATTRQITTWFKMSKIFTPDEAKSINIISDIRELAVPGSCVPITIPTGNK